MNNKKLSKQELRDMLKIMIGLLTAEQKKQYDDKVTKILFNKTEIW
mgnify:CR=1 FL=1|jgi:hypothetical protein